MKSLSKFLVFILVMCGVNTVRAQESLQKDEAKKEAEVQKIVSSGRYTFEATKEISKTGNRPLKRGDNLDISKDTLIARLPDLGKAPSAPVSARASGITCNRFTYNMEQGQHGRTEVIIKPEQKSTADKDVKELKLNISSLGYGTLTVIRTDKSPVTYYGYIKQEGVDFPNTSLMR